MKNSQHISGGRTALGSRILPFLSVAVLLFFCWLVPGRSVASEIDARSGCTGFNSTHTNQTLDTCKKKICFTVHMEGQFMHGTQNWHVDWGDGIVDDTTTTGISQGVNGWDSITYVVCHTYSATGTYNITLSVTPAHTTCMDQFQITIPPHNASFTYNSVCVGGTTNFSGNSTSATGWIWTFGDGGTSTVQNPTHTYVAPGSYSVTLIATSTGCNDTIKHVVNVNPPPVANFKPTTVCLGNQTCFTDQSTIAPGTIASWSWNFGDPSSGANNTSTAQSPCHKYSVAGTYSTTLTVTSDSGCVNVITLPVIVLPLPTAAFIPNAPCLGTTTSLTDGSLSAAGDPINSWNWAMPAGLPATATTQNAATIYPAAGTHTVTLIVTSQKGCKDTITQQVLVYNPPVANFSKPDSGCAPICVNYNDLSTSTDGTINSWQWTFPGGTPQTSSSATPQNICYNTPGSYSVSLIVSTTFGCKDTIALPMINVFPWPTAEFCVAPLVAPVTTPVFNFCDMWSSDVVQWSWNFGDNDSDHVNTDPVHSYSLTANNNDFYSYQICIRVQNIHGCWDTTCHVVELIPEFEFYIPNCFTPNGDFVNEMFYGKSRGVKEYNIWVFDRWGNQLWDCHREDKNTNWDSDASIPKQEGLSSACQWNGVVVQGGMDMSGNSRQLAQEDVYVWKVRLTDIFNKKHTYIGHVSIVK
jgi:PKD repeat protein